MHAALAPRPARLLEPLQLARRGQQRPGLLALEPQVAAPAQGRGLEGDPGLGDAVGLARRLLQGEAPGRRRAELRRQHVADGAPALQRGDVPGEGDEVAPEARFGKQLRRARGIARLQGGLEPVEPSDHPLVGGRQPLELSNHGVHRGSSSFVMGEEAQGVCQRRNRSAAPRWGSARAGSTPGCSVARIGIHPTTSRSEASAHRRWAGPEGKLQHARRFFEPSSKIDRSQIDTSSGISSMAG